jgi:hypothetical protein
VRPFPNVNDAGRQQVSTNGGTQPLWARNRQELFYESMGTLMRVPVKTGAPFERGTPAKVFDAPYLVRQPGQALGRLYDVSSFQNTTLLRWIPMSSAIVVTRGAGRSRPPRRGQNVNRAPSWIRRALLVLPFNRPKVLALVSAPVV